MAANEDTGIGGSQSSFPSTRWSMLETIQGKMTEAHRDVLNLLIQRYWKPVYCYVRRRGYGNEDAKDLVQEFFTSWLVRDLFGRADPTRGRFRALLLTSLDNFLKNQHRARQAKRRHPTHGLVSLEELVQEEDLTFEPCGNETPDMVYHRVWISELLMRVLNTLKDEYEAAGREDEYDLFYRRVVAPALESIEPPPLRVMAEQLGMTEKQAANRVITARRAYQRLLRKEVRLFASSEDDLAAEIRDLFLFLSES